MSSILNYTSIITNTTTSAASASKLQYLYSVDSLTTKFLDYTNVFFLPLASLFGIITNMLSIIIIAFLNKKEFMNNFMLTNSILNLIFSLINIFIVIIRCGSLCPLGYKFYSKVYELYIYLFVGNIIILTCVLMDLVVSLNRLFSFSKKRSSWFAIKKENFKYVFSIILFISTLIMTICYLLTRQVTHFGYLIIQKNDTNETIHEPLYKVSSNFIGDIDAIKQVVFILNLFRGSVLMVLLFLINLTIAFKYQQYMKRKSKKFTNISSNYVHI